MTRPQPRLSQLPLWERHVEMVLSVLRDALQILSERWPTGGELDRNRFLVECLLLAMRSRYNKGLSTIDSPIFNEARNQPSPETLGESPERKIPDFQCGYIDHLAPDPLYSAKYFVIECKRLGDRTFNDNYVGKGIVRFVDPDFRYGNNVKSGAMVGYVEGDSIDVIIEAVNTALGERGIAPLSNQLQSQSLNELNHQLVRSFPENPFSLTHLWISDGNDSN